LGVPTVKFSKKSSRHPSAIEPGGRFDIDDAVLESTTGDLFISTSSSGHVFVNREGSRELELAKDLWEVIFGGEPILPSIQSGFGPSGIETSG
jgi:hypothetical protein